MKTLILAGGYGTRLSEETGSKPKPMVEIGGRPILWHIMKIYAAFGYKEFITALGYKSDVIKRYFLDLHHARNNVTVHLESGQVEVHPSHQQVEDWTVHMIETGLDTDTGGRIKRVAASIGDETFMMTYGDGVSDVDIGALVAFHRAHGRLATITAVRPPSRFGGLELDERQVTQYVEKPQIGEGWINGGFFVLEPGVLDFIAGDETRFEREPLELLASSGQLMAYQHQGFWQPMDTLRDVRLLNQLWENKTAPWRSW